MKTTFVGDVFDRNQITEGVRDLMGGRVDDLLILEAVEEVFEGLDSIAKRLRARVRIHPGQQTQCINEIVAELQKRHL